MEVKQIDPDELEIDPLNERNENVGPHKDDESLEESIREQGVIQPPIVRQEDGSHKVVVGQRRTLAAQSAGVDKIPVVVTDWDDAEAIEASVTENVDAFRKSVSRSDRAAALQKLMDITGWSASKISDKLGVSERSVQYWLERTRDEWSETSVHVDQKDEIPEEKKEQVDNVRDRDLSTIRRATDSPEEREEAVQKVAESNLSSDEIRKARKESDRGNESFDEVVEEISAERDEREGMMRVQTKVTFTGDYAEGLREAAKNSGTSEERIVKKALEKYLSDEGYL